MKYLGGAAVVGRQEKFVPADVSTFLSQVTEFVNSQVEINPNQPPIDTTQVMNWEKQIEQANAVLNNEQNKSALLNQAAALSITIASPTPSPATAGQQIRIDLQQSKHELAAQKRASILNDRGDFKNIVTLARGTAGFRKARDFQDMVMLARVMVGNDDAVYHRTRRSDHSRVVAKKTFTLYHVINSALRPPQQPQPPQQQQQPQPPDGERRSKRSRVVAQAHQPPSRPQQPPQPPQLPPRRQQPQQPPQLPPRRQLPPQPPDGELAAGSLRALRQFGETPATAFGTTADFEAFGTAADFEAFETAADFGTAFETAADFEEFISSKVFSVLVWGVGGRRRARVRQKGFA